MEFLFLFIRDILPKGYNEQGIYQDDPSISRYTLLSKEDNPISIAWKKWLDYIIEDYIFFWDVFPNKIKFGELQDQDFIQLHDLFEIITFINPQAIQIILNDPKLFEFSKLIRLKAIDRQYHVQSRHSTYHVWMIYGRVLESQTRTRSYRNHENSKENRGFF